MEELSGLIRTTTFASHHSIGLGCRFVILQPLATL
jgi:hypothetical protein